MPSNIQAVIFEKYYWNESNAERELKLMGLHPIKAAHHTHDYIRYRIRNPHEFRRFITKPTNKHMKLVIGFY